MNNGSAPTEIPRSTSRRARRVILAGLLATAVAVAGLVAAGVIPWAPSGPAGSYRIGQILVSFTGSGAQALCPETNSTPPTCGSAAQPCGPATLCNETLRTGETVPLNHGISFQAMLSNTFDCNYTFSIAQVSGAGAFTVSSAQANGGALPVNVGFSGSGNACVTVANISVGLAVGDQGPSEQNIVLTVDVAQELR